MSVMLITNTSSRQSNRDEKRILWSASPLKLISAPPLLSGSIRNNRTGSRPSRLPFERTAQNVSHAARVNAVRGRFSFVNTNSHEFAIRRRAELEQEE